MYLFYLQSVIRVTEVNIRHFFIDSWHHEKSIIALGLKKALKWNSTYLGFKSDPLEVAVLTNWKHFGSTDHAATLQKATGFGKPLSALCINVCACGFTPQVRKTSRSELLTLRSCILKTQRDNDWNHDRNVVYTPCMLLCSAKFAVQNK